MGISKQLAVFLLFLTTLVCSARNYPPTFRVVATNATGEYFFTTQVEVESSGNIMWAGGYYGKTLSLGSQTFTNDNQFESDIYVFKTGPDLEVLWAKAGGGEGYQSITGMAVDTAGNVFFAAHGSAGSLDFDGITYTTSSNYTTGIFKYSPSGQRIWARRVDGILSDPYNKALTLDSNGAVIVGGAFEDNRSFLLKLDANGEVIWSRNGPAIRYDLSLAVKTDSNRNIYFLSSFTNTAASFGSTTISNGGLRNYALIKYSPDGDVIWGGVGGGSNSLEDYGVDLVVDETGNSYVLSQITSTNAKFGQLVFQLNSPAWFLTKYDPDGQSVWAKAFSITRNNSLALGGLSLTKNGNILISASCGEDYFLPTPEFSTDFLTECTLDGDVLWTKRVRLHPEDPGDVIWFSRVVSDRDNNLYVSGLNNGSGPVGLDSFHLSNSRFIAKLSFDPQLTTSLTGNLLTVSWPTNEPGFNLEGSIALDEPITWEAVTNAVASTNGHNVISGLPIEGTRFYRLRKTTP